MSGARKWYKNIKKVLKYYETLLVQILVVAGGTGEDFEPLTSTEVLILGDWTEWQFAADLPGPKVMMVIMIMTMIMIAMIMIAMTM